MALDGDISSFMLKWIIASGVKVHMTPHKHAFDTYNTIATKVFMRDDGVVEVVGMGSILMEMEEKGHMERIRLRDVLRVPKLQGNLLSMSKLETLGCKVQCKTLGCIVTLNGQVVATAMLENKLYVMGFKKVMSGGLATLTHTPRKQGMWELWPLFLGFLNMKSVRAIPNMEKIMILYTEESDEIPFVCKYCIVEFKQF